MKNRINKAISVILTLALALSLCIPSALAVAEDGSDAAPPTISTADTGTDGDPSAAEPSSVDNEEPGSADSNEPSGTDNEEFSSADSSEPSDTGNEETEAEEDVSDDGDGIAPTSLEEDEDESPLSAENAVASITSSAGAVSYYETLSAAFAAANSGDTITLLAKPANDANAVVITPDNISITYDLNGFTHNRTGNSALITVTSGTSLTIKDSVGTGSLTNKIVVNGGGSVIVENATFTGSNGIVVNSNGSLTVNGGTFSTSSTSISGADGSTILINDGSFSGSVTSTGTLVIKDGTFRAVTAGANSSNETAKVTIDGGTFSGTVTASYKSDVTINGGTFNGKISTSGSSTKAPTLTINDGSFSGNLALGAIGTVTITGGTFDGNVTSIGAKISVTVTGGTFNIADVSAYLPEGYQQDEDGTVSAPRYEASVTSGGTVTNYESFADAIAAVGDGDIITLLNDVTSTSIISKDNITLDLNGHTYTSTKTKALTVTGSLTIQDSTGGGTITASTGRGISVEGGTLVLDSGSICAPGSNGYGIYVASSGSATINGGSVTGSYDAVYVSKGSVTINGGSFTSTYSGKSTTDQYGAILASSGTVTINNGTFNGWNGIFVKGTYVTINGGTFNGTNTGIYVNNAGATINGGFFQGGNYSAYIYQRTLDISNGYFDGALGKDSTATITVSGGTFTDDPSAYVAEGISVVSSSVVHDGVTYNYTVGKAAASVTSGDTVTAYETLKAAIEAAEVGDTITLLADVDEQTYIPAGKDVILDLNGYTLTSTKTGTYPLYIYGTLTVKDSSEAGTGNIFSSMVTVMVRGGTFILESGTLYSGKNSSAINLDDGSTVIVNGGSIDATRCIGASFDATAVSIEVNGGSFSATSTIIASADGISITGGYFSSTFPLLFNGSRFNGTISGGYFNKSIDSQYVAEGYMLVPCSVTVGDVTYTYTVSRAAASVTSGETVTYYSTAKEAVAAAESGDTVTLLKDVEANLTIYDNTGIKNITLDLNGYTLSYGQGSYPVTVRESGILTIVDSSEAGTGTISGTRPVVVMGGTLTLESGTLTGSYYGLEISKNGGSVTINGGTITGDSRGVSVHGSAVAGLTINGGVITGGTSYAVYAICDDLSINGGYISNTGNPPFDPALFSASMDKVITGGYFTQDPSKYVANGYHTVSCTEELNGVTYTYMVVACTPSEAVIENTVDPTCTEDGSYDSVVYCSVCGAEISRVTVTVPATGHTPAEAVIENKVAPSCTKDGSYDSVVYCSVCGAEISRVAVTVPATGHTVVTDKAVAPTCTETGLTEGSHCSVCGEVLTAQKVVAATGHTYGAPTFNWAADHSACTAAYACTVCGAAETAACTVTSTTTAATANANGKTEYTATVTIDGVTYTSTTVVTIPATSTSTSVKTGDSTPLLVVVCIMTIALAGLAALAVQLRKRRS